MTIKQIFIAQLARAYWVSQRAQQWAWEEEKSLRRQTHRLFPVEQVAASVANHVDELLAQWRFAHHRASVPMSIRMEVYENHVKTKSFKGESLNRSGQGTLTLMGATPSPGAEMRLYAANQRPCQNSK